MKNDQIKQQKDTMNIKEYTLAAARTDCDYAAAMARLDSSTLMLLHAAIGLATEAHEMVAGLKNDDPVNRAEEAGDWCWYSGLACNSQGIHPPILLSGKWRKSPRVYKEAVMEAAEAAGELLDLVKKSLFYGPSERDRQIPGLLVNCWLIADKLAQSNGTDLESVMRANIAKLAVRYPDKFTAADAHHRELAAEADVVSAVVSTGDTK